MNAAPNQNAPKPEEPLIFVRNVVIKALVLFVIANLLFAAVYPLDALGRISVYNFLFPGRQRLPYGDDPDKAYNLSLFNLEAMLASHQIAGSAKPDDEFRIILIGDSSTWGFLLPNEHTLSSYLNQTLQNTRAKDGRQIRIFNLGYPVMSVTKDLLILSYVMRYEPDLIIWPLTLESLPYDKQLFPPLMQNNPAAVKELIEKYQLNLDPISPEFVMLSGWDRTLIGARRPLADLIRLQLYGVLWAATGIDQDIPATYTPRMDDLPADEDFHNLHPPQLYPSDLAIDVLQAGIRMAGDIPVLLVNEPMYISQGENSQIRYNFFYPRWAYDDYRQIMLTQSAAMHWDYLDLWDAVANSEFTNSAVHLTAAGTRQFAQRLAQVIQERYGLTK
jgi:hypothetical protein